MRPNAATLLSWIALGATHISVAAGAAEQLPDLLLPPGLAPQDGAHAAPVEPAAAGHQFTLRHVFHRGTTDHPDLHRRLDVQAGMSAYAHPPMTDDLWADVGPFSARSNALQIQRLVDRRVERLVGLEDHARRGGYRPVLPESDWTVDEVSGPNITDQETVVNLARMAACAYNEGPDDPEWYDVGKTYNRSADFGWQGDGLRGHVFADKTNETIVISIKGTSKAVFDGAETTTNDKLNDNLFFGCCCGQGTSSLMIKAACNCMTDTFTCNNTCVTEELKQKNNYWRASVDLYDNVTTLYPHASNIWLVGHSLGGSVSALLGLTVGQPAVTFEAPGDALAAGRLGLPVPPGLSATDQPQKRQLTGAFHFGHNADPVFTGTCNGWGASCPLGGYALESECHTGYVCEYDMQKDWGWRNVMTNHGIRVCISSVYEAYDKPAECRSNAGCDSDCALWKYFESNGSDITTTRTSMSSTSTSSLTRTETCKTPGWWGCLDESTTESFTTTLTTTLTTTTCSSYGWFGQCLDPITTTETLTSTLAEATSASATTTTTKEAPSTQTTETCTSRGWFGRCLDDDARTSTTSSSTLAAAHRITPAPALAMELR